VKRPHRADKHVEIEPILSCLSERNPLPWEALSKISPNTAIPAQTLSKWHRNLHKTGNEDEFSQAKGYANRRIFEERTESALHSCLLDNLMKLENRATLQDFQALALNACSFLCEFLPEETSRSSQAAADAFLSRLNTITRDCPPERTFYTDEMVGRPSRAPERCLQKIGRNCEIDGGKR
jgi:hypothetical protein